VVKADAYGLGVRAVAPALRAAGCGTFFVATLDEGLSLRSLLGNEPSIVVLHGVADLGEAGEARARNLLPVLNSLPQIETWAARARSVGAPLPCALHLDTGMNRLGLSAGEVQALGLDHHLLDGCDVRLTMSHLACAEDAANQMNRSQLVTFLKRCAALSSAPQSLANSAGIFLGEAFTLDMVRPGIALYGGNPVPGASPSPVAQVVRLEAPILQVRRVDRGDTVGYGATFSVPGPTRIATVAAGYADGYLRSASGRGRAVVSGHFAPIVGRVSMDLITVDVSAVPEHAAQPGATARLLGLDITVDEVAGAAGTIPYEILTSLGRRYRREYQPDQAKPSPKDLEAIGARN
jgi:alanine racemase